MKGTDVSTVRDRIGWTTEAGIEAKKEAKRLADQGKEAHA